jgi:hypothetical protein
MLNDPAGAALVDAAYKKQASRSREWMAGNMVAWFSQKITTTTSEHKRHFERRRKKPYAYKPIARV